jgi:lipid-A-disaccharide synthase-like uncharacterized protein
LEDEIIKTLFSDAYLWIAFGFLAQFVFFLRFIIQWYESEKKKKSVIPISFWYISIVGTLMIILYSYHIKDIVFFVANVLSLVIYFRNIALLKKNAATTEGVVGAEEIEIKKGSK